MEESSLTEDRKVPHFERRDMKNYYAPLTDIIIHRRIGVFPYLKQVTNKAEVHSVLFEGRLYWYNITSIF